MTCLLVLWAISVPAGAWMACRLKAASDAEYDAFTIAQRHKLDQPPR
jgi:hypothetical protein